MNVLTLKDKARPDWSKAYAAMFTSNTSAECKARCAVMLKHIGSWPLATSQGLKSSLCLYFSCPLLSALPLYIQVVSFSLKDLSLWSCPSPLSCVCSLQVHFMSRPRNYRFVWGEEGWMDGFHFKKDMRIKTRCKH